MIKIDTQVKPADLSIKLNKFWDLSAQKIELIEKEMNMTLMREPRELYKSTLSPEYHMVNTYI